MATDKWTQVDGKKFAELRRSKFLSQEEFAQGAEMTKGNVARIEGEDITGIQLETLRGVAAFVGLTPEQLLERIGIKEPGRVAARRPDDNKPPKRKR